MHEKVARVPELFVLIVAVFVFLVAVGAVEAQQCEFGYGFNGPPFVCQNAEEEEEEGMDPFPWTSQGHHWSRFDAQTIATNKANTQCNTYGLIRDANLDQMTTGQSTLDCGIGNCWIATLRYWCKDRPPRTVTRWLFGVEGPLTCTDSNLDPVELPAYWTFEATARNRCDAIDPRLNWGISQITNTRIAHDIPTGSCGDADGWYTPRKVAIKGDVQCSANY